MNIFNWFRSKDEVTNPTKNVRNARKVIDWTDSMQANSEFTRGIWHNSYPGMKLAGSLAYSPIAIPASFMGLPIAETDNDKINEQLELITKQMEGQIKDIHIQCHREGTIWIYPKFSQGKLNWEFIPDDSVTDIIRDLSTNEVIQIEVREQLTIATGDGNTATVDRTRIYTKNKVSIVYSGSVPAGLKSTVSRNPAGILPIPFSNNADGGEVRGHSDYERIMTDLKSYHDIDLAEQNILAKFKIKMVQKVKNVKDYATNNNFNSVSEMFNDLDLSELDLIMNELDEDTTFIFPERATDAYRAAKVQRFHKIIEGSAIPEIAWGLKTTGNLASVEENMAMLMNFVRDKREQKNEAYKTLFTASLVLLNQAMLIDTVPEIEISWDKLDNLSEKTKSEVFANFAKSLNSLISVAALSKEQLHKIWIANYPDVTEDTIEEFTIGLSNMAGHVVETRASVEQRMIANGSIA